jgi:RNA polymerase sigma factor (sigma-70 family)
MNQSTFDRSQHNPEKPDFDHLIKGVVAGDPVREDKLYQVLMSHLKISVRLFLDSGRMEVDDVVVESITAVFKYIRRDGGFTGDLVAFSITIARNRCRNILNQQQRRPQTPIEPLADWIANDDRSPLDHLVKEESLSLLQQTVDSLDRICRTLLRAVYFEESSIESIRIRLGLKTVQGVYYRRTICLRELGNRMMNSA